MPEFLGTIGKKEYYLSDPDANGKRKLQWRVPNTREAIRSHPGWKVISADYSQIEVKIMAERSNDQWLIGALKSGKDIHCYMASDTEKIPYDEFYAVYKNKNHKLHSAYNTIRNNTKNITFGVPYGARGKKVAMLANRGKKLNDPTWMTVETADRMVGEWFKKAYGLKIWLDQQTILALRDKFTSTPNGRKRFYRIPKKELYNGKSNPDYGAKISQLGRWAGNQPIQSECADMLKKSLIRIYLALRGGKWAGKRIYRAYIMASVHDEIIVAAHENDAEAVAKIVTDCMQQVYEETMHQIPNKVDATIADYWKK